MNASKAGVPETQTGMISPSETELCGESAARYSGKEGAIVDLGCWLGATSVALARGILSDRSKADEKVLGFDQFQWENGIEYLIDCRGRRTVITATHDLHIFEEIAEQCSCSAKAGSWPPARRRKFSATPLCWKKSVSCMFIAIDAPAASFIPARISSDRTCTNMRISGRVAAVRDEIVVR